ncbi:hypothetical protein AR457_24030 [Streptomyces agglomeratus]|uniref:hypothetical protein n=1 Tax=Streptomyces agglomeratus TaxID=285458 RepID=UPI000854139F|nr:hypothetical protein [Streptomyces agglomeratus]OEJ38879.1 hypothetical protein BGK70_12625 [Streptomyces agglomeratus]OEJ46738.1 hypothetical protein AR457_24030 [Streptomyces agglomeratus]
MSTVWIIALIAVVVVLLVAVFLVAGPGKGGGGRGLKRRFGPEYDRVVAHHDGDTKAAERELEARVKRHGSLEPRPLTPEIREQYVARWAGVQEQFVDSPQRAVAEADRLLARLAADRGFPADNQYDEQVSALSVHHADKVQGYRRVHRAAHTENSSTEQMREAMLDARELFETLVTAKPADSGKHRPQHAEERHGRAQAPWSLGKGHHPKGSGA